MMASGNSIKISTYISTVFAAILLMFGASNAQAGIWPELPVACLPERAVPWDDNKSLEDQAPCHCPPLSLCPQTREEYVDKSSNKKMPASFIRRCCPKIPVRRTCPDGKSVPESGRCVIPQACPLKNYPSLEESGTFVGSNYTTNYKYSDREAYQFNNDTWPGDSDYHVARLGDKYDFSLRIANSTYWVWGPMFCLTYGDGAGLYGGGDFSRPRCAFQNGYSPLTNGVNNGSESLERVVGDIGPDKLTWFGFSVARIDNLPNNLVTENLYADLDDELVEIANNSFQGFDEGYRSYDVETLDSIKKDRPELLQLCRAVQGEFLEVQYKDVAEVNAQGQKTGKMLQCPYLQCRYVYETDFESCLAGQTKIALADGSTQAISRLAVGDKVKTADGSSALVTATNRYLTKKRVLMQ